MVPINSASVYLTEARLLKIFHASNVASADAAELLDIKRGSSPLDAVKAAAQPFFPHYLAPGFTHDGHSLRRLDGQPFVGATTEMMEVVKRYRGEPRRYYSGDYMGQKRRELVRRVGYDASFKRLSCRLPGDQIRPASWKLK